MTATTTTFTGILHLVPRQYLFGESYHFDYVVSMTSGRAITHNDLSIQENHHVMSMFVMMSEDKSLHFLDVRT